MTLKNLQFLLTALILALMPAFILRPVVVCVHDSGLVPSLERHSAAPDAYFQASSPSRVIFRKVEREAPDTAFWMPAFIKTGADGCWSFRLAVVPCLHSLSPPIFRILRI